MGAGKEKGTPPSTCQAVHEHGHVARAGTPRPRSRGPGCRLSRQASVTQGPRRWRQPQPPTLGLPTPWQVLRPLFCVYLSGPPARRPSQGAATLGGPRMAGAARQGSPGPGVHAPAGHPGASRCRRQSPRGGGGLAGNAAALSCLNRKRAPCPFPPAVIAAPRNPGGKLAFSGTTTQGMDFSFGISTFHFPGQRGQRAGRGALAIKPGASPRIGTERQVTDGSESRLGSPPCLSNCVSLTWSLGFSELLRLRGQHGRPILQFL